MDTLTLAIFVSYLIGTITGLIFCLVIAVTFLVIERINAKKYKSEVIKNEVSS